MTIFTAAEGESAAERLANEQQSIFENLMQLEDHLGRKLLDSAAVEGVTRERGADVLAGCASLWTLYETYRTAVARVRSTMARRSRPTRAKLREVEELVSGIATVTLPSPDGSLLGRQVTLDELVGEIQTQYGRVHEVVSAVDRVWTELSPRIDSCEKLLREARAQAAELGLTADQDPAVAALADLADRLDTVRRIALTDPLRLWADDAVDLVEADRLVSSCVGVQADLHALGELPHQAQRRLDQVDATLTEIRRLDQEISAQHRLVHAKIHSSPGPEPAESTHPLGPRLADAAELCRREHWQQLGAELPALERDADAALQRARADLTEAGQPLRERAELRGRLSAYRAKAAGRGRIEDLALEQRYERARDLLWRAPCDLPAATTALADYQDAVNTTVADQDPT